MKSSYKSLVFLFVVLIQNENFIHCFAAPRTLDNKPIHKDEDEVKSFREKYALRMKSWMNTSVDPCDDFYEFACGNYQNHNIEEDVGKHLTDMIDITLQKHRYPGEKFSEELRKAEELFNSCIDAEISHLEPKEEFLEVLKAIGGFPAIDSNWNASGFDWFNMSAHLSRYGIEGFVREDILQQRMFIPSYGPAKLGFSGLDLNLENIANKKSPGYVENENIMMAILNLYSVSGTKANKIIEDIIEFWREALLHTEPFMAGCANTAGIEFSKWNSYFKIAWEGTKHPPSIKCACPPYYNALDKTIAKFPKAAANYMALKFLSKIHTGYIKQNERTFCLNMVKSNFPLLLNHFYMKDHYNKSAENDIYKMITEIELSMSNMFKSADWLDELTRLEALKKIHTIRTHVGVVVDSRILEMYINKINNLNLTDNFASNRLHMSKFTTDMLHFGYLNAYYLLQSKVPKYFIDSIFQVQAEYHISENSINVFAGLLLPPLYHQYLPKSLNYGSLGSIAGHEISHMFNNINSAWGTEGSKKAFNERANCFAQHYSEFKIHPEIKLTINGAISLYENVADSVGLRASLSAFRRVVEAAKKNQVKDFEENEHMPGLDMTPEQKFFLSFAQSYCANYNLNDYKIAIADVHPLKKYRVMGSLQNFDDFPSVFNCPLDSRMNPSHKCRLL